MNLYMNYGTEMGVCCMALISLSNPCRNLMGLFIFMCHAVCHK